MRSMRPSTRIGLSLLEVMLCSMIVAIVYVAIVKTMGMSIRLSERAELRSELTAAAHREVETLRAIAARHPDFHPDYLHTIPGVPSRIWVTSHPVPGESLLALHVSAEAIVGSPPLVVTMTGWIGREVADQ